MNIQKNSLIKKRLLGIILAAACTFQSTGIVSAIDSAPEGSGTQAEQQAPSTQAVHIRTAKDLITLSQHSKTDSYSKGKTFYLENDIDLTETEFIPIAVFTGIFDGKGHTISGFTLTESGKDFGLFRYVEEGAVIRNLTVSGNICPDGSMEHIGGIAGTNRGRIDKCVFQGTLTAKKTAGGIAGYNAPEGIIADCTNQGTLTVTKQGGGIAGRNEGVIRYSTNKGNINASTQTVSEIIGEQPSITLDFSSLGTDEKKINYIGGIAGTSSGQIFSCSNSGQVGYQHTGYNIGGIVGYHQGKIENCTNNGQVFGRKNIGGIAGQFEPHVVTVYEEDSSDNLRSQGQDLRHMMDSLSDTLGNAADSAGSHMDDIGNTMDELSTLVNDNIDYYLDWGDDFSKDIQGELDDLEDTFDRLGVDARPIRRPLQDIRSGLEDFNGILDQMGSGGNKTEWNKVENNVHQSLKTFNQVMKIRSELNQNLNDLVAMLYPQTPEPTPPPEGEIPGEGTEGSEKNPDEEAPSPGLSPETIQKITEQAEDLIDYISRYLTDLEAELEGTDEFEENSEMAQSMDYFCSAALAQVDEMESLLANEEIPPQDAEAIRQKLAAIRKNIQDINALLGSLVGPNGTTEDIDWDKLHTETQDTKDNISALRRKGNSILGHIDDLLYELSDSGDELHEDAQDVRRQAEHLSNYVRTSLNSLRKDADTTHKDVDKQTDTLSSQMKGLKNDMRDYRSQISSQLDLISDQLGLLGDTAADGLDNIRDKLVIDPEKELYNDLSDDESTDVERGIIYRCRNNGGIAADINGGGIIGLIGVEMDLESDFSIEEIGERSFNSDSNLRATVLTSRNFGNVTVKNNCAGGIVGRSDAGAVIHCDNFGEIKSTSGSYVGGIAGRSHFLIRESYSLCDVTGQDYVGGIAGLGCSANNNYVMAGIYSETGEKNGSIFGDLDDEGSPSLYQNYYIDEGLAAVNNLTYESAAQSIRYQDLLKVAGTPKEFKSFTVQFVADGKIIKRISCNYGQSIKPEEIPAVPEQNGLAGVWEDKDLSFIRRNMTIEAKYSDFLTAIASPEDTPLLFAVGNYREQNQLECRELPIEDVPHIEGYRPVRAYHYQILFDSIAPDPPSKLRVLADDGKNYTILAWNDEGNVSLIHPVKDGRYLAFATDMQNFAIVKSKSVLSLVGICISVTVLVLAFVVIQKRKTAGAAPSSRNEKKRGQVPPDVKEPSEGQEK